MIKKMFIITCLITSFVILNGAIGWSGNIWPNSGSNHVNGNDISVYYQIWKGGTTDAVGQGADISATLYYRLQGETIYNSVAMSYNGDVGNNDEYSAILPNTAFDSNDIVEWYCEGLDTTDMSYSYGTDQSSGGPFDDTNPGTFNITAGLNQAVTVTFQVYMGNIDPTWYVNGVSVQGSVLPLNWTAGSTLMSDGDSDLTYTVDVLFPAGSNASVEFKFTRNDNSKAWQWEGIGNRSLTINDSEPTQTVDLYSWDSDSPLPVTLSTFSAIYENNSLLLQWTTQSESNNSHWNVYRSESGNFGQANQINGSTIEGYGTTSEPSYYSYQDVDTPLPDTSYWYWLESVDYSGETSLHGPVSVTTPQPDNPEPPATPVQYGLKQNYPNPFNPSTEIRFNLAQSQNVELTIFDVKGKKVKTLHKGFVDADSEASFVWNGTNENGKNVSSGIYFYKLVTSEKTETKKMLLVK